jgi:hypothetical protein
LHGSDENGSAGGVGDFEPHAPMSGCFSRQFGSAPHDFRDQGSHTRELNSILIFDKAKVIADMEVVDSHRVAALSTRKIPLALEQLLVPAPYGQWIAGLLV